jgi:predicted O-methyltransferase YrrM
MYKFTSDWFSANTPVWDYYLSEFKNKPDLNFLEIGSYEGRSTIWLLENILTDSSSKIHCIDLFDGTLPDNDMTTDSNLNLDYYQTFLNNIESFKSKVIVHKGYSYKILKQFQEEEILDFVYIDGAHTSYETLMDAVYVDPLLKKGGIIIFDDYELRPSEIIQNCPKLGIDCFYNVFLQQYEVLHVGWQVVLKKINNIHIA